MWKQAIFFIRSFTLRSFVVGCAIIPVVSSADTLNLLNWDEYIAESVISAFEAETGHVVKTVVFDSDDDRDEILSGESADSFDLAVVDSLATLIFGKNKLLHPISELKSKVLNKAKLQWRDSCGGFGIPYFWGTLGIVYRADKISQKPDSWRDLMQPEESLKGHIGMHLDLSDTLIPPLKLAGYSINSEEKSELKVAYTTLIEQKPFVLTYEYVVSYNKQHEGEHELYMAMAYSGDQYVLNSEQDGSPWVYVIPKEGSVIWVDCLAIIESSQHKEAAMAFIEFLSRSEVAAENANEVGAATVNLGAMPLLDKAMVDDKSIYPPKSLLTNSEHYQMLSIKAISQRNRVVRVLGKGAH